MLLENRYKQLPFRLSTGYGGACSLTTFANLFNNGYYLTKGYTDLANQKEIGGLLFSEEVFALNELNGVLLEPALLNPKGIELPELVDIFSEVPEGDEVFVYLIRSIKGDLTVKDSEARGHRFAILKAANRTLLVVDSYYDNSYLINSISELNTAKPLNQYDKIVGIDILYNSNRTRKVFTRNELSHLL